MKLVFVTVNYNNIDETRKVLNCFSGLSHGENSVLYVVDNSDSKSECQSLDKENTNNKIKFLYPKENLGYLTGASFGVDFHYNNHGFDFDYLIILNNDIIFNVNEVLKSLEIFSQNNDAMMISPLVIDRGVNVNPYLTVRKSKRYMMFWNFILSNFFTFKVFHKINKYRALLSSKNNFFFNSTAIPKNLW